MFYLALILLLHCTTYLEKWFEAYLDSSGIRIIALKNLIFFKIHENFLLLFFISSPFIHADLLLRIMFNIRPDNIIYVLHCPY